MYKKMLAVFFVLFVLCGAIYSADAIKVPATIFFKDGRTVQATNIVHFQFRNSSSDYIVFKGLNSETLSLHKSELKDIMIISKEKEWKNGELVHVIHRNGNSADFYLNVDNYLYSIKYDYFDAFSGQSYDNQEIRFSNIERITFGDEIGDVKTNPKRDQIFPSVYNYDPYTGERLVWAPSVTIKKN